MSGALDGLVALDESERRRLGAVHTLGEIRQQPELWLDTARRVVKRGAELKYFLAPVMAGMPSSRSPCPAASSDAVHGRGRSAGAGTGLGFGPGPSVDIAADPGPAVRSAIVMAGAGSSDYVGRSLEQFLRRRLGTFVDSRPTTDIVTNPLGVLVPDVPHVIILFSRSGQSPESIAAFDIVAKIVRDARFIVITCNPEGDLARLARRHPDRLLGIELDPRTCDRGLAMTSSATSMMIAGQFLGFLDSPEEFVSRVSHMALAAERLLGDLSSRFRAIAAEPFERAVVLGTGPLHGAAIEAALKMQELTDGRVMTKAETYLGLRHGPEAAIDDHTLVVFFLSSDGSRQRYELDLVRELASKGLGLKRIAIAARAPLGIAGFVDECIEFDPDGRAQVADDLRPPVDVVSGQMLALFKALDLGISPDQPSTRGAINRVVQGVTIYPADIDTTGIDEQQRG